MSEPHGFTLVEIVVVLGVIAIVAAGTAGAWWPAAAGVAAREYRAALHGARLRAVAGMPTSIRFDVDRDAFVIRDAPDAAARCLGPVRRLLPRRRGVAVTKRLRDGLVWLPDGMGRDCSGGGVYGGRVRFEGRHSGWDVVVSSSGRLRLEAMP